MNSPQINGKTNIPLGWVFALLMGCATFTGLAVKLGEYVGGTTASAANLTDRLGKLEVRVDSEAIISSRIDRRLFRLELSQHILVPNEDRLPAAVR